MNITNLIFTSLFSLFLSFSAQSQFLEAEYVKKMYNYKDCVAILYKGKVLVNEYSPDGICKLETGMKGLLTVATVELSANSVTPDKNVGFKVAIKNKRTNTIYMYSEETMKEVRIEDVLEKCEQEDRIIIMTVDQRHALPHNEIEIFWGC